MSNENGLRYIWCDQCHDSFPMRQDIHDGLEECGNTYYCPRGHSLIVSRKNIVDQLRRAERQATYRSDQVSVLLKRTQALRGVQTRQHKRLLRGACPYCNLTSRDIVRHIQERHKLKVT